MRTGCWTILAALALAGCERADMQVCQPLPSAADASKDAFYDGGLLPAATGGAGTRRAAQRAAVLACLRRNAYLLTKSGASVEQVTGAVATNCDEMITALILADVGPAGALADEAAARGRDFFRRQAEAMVLEARAGHCWAQGRGAGLPPLPSF